MKWLTFSANGFAFTGVLLTLSYKARFGRSMKWLALSTNCLAFARLRHRGGDKARGDQSNKSTRLIATSGLFLKLSLGSDKRWQKLYLTWIKFRIVAHELSSMLDWLFLKC